VAHIALAVSNQARSRGFYETYFGFDPGTAMVAEDGVLLIEGPGGVLLALGETDEPIELPSFSTSASRARRTPRRCALFATVSPATGSRSPSSPTSPRT
jgi:catechol 2,3-dioxygenase-like lactoylglutathione lyase family enzyme